MSVDLDDLSAELEGLSVDVKNLIAERDILMREVKKLTAERELNINTIDLLGNVVKDFKNVLDRLRAETDINNPVVRKELRRKLSFYTQDIQGNELNH